MKREILFRTFKTILISVGMSLVISGQAALAQSSVDLRGDVGGSGIPGGSVMLGFDTDACSSTRAGAIRYNSATTCAEFCNGSDWICTSEAVASPSPPTGCTSPGETCDDGSVFAGLSPDGYVPMYTTPADAPSLYTWNDGSTNYTDMSMANCTDASPGTATTCQTGEANTALLVGATGEPDYPFAAAEYCDGLSAHGYSDWYLPAQDELNVLYANKNAGDLNGTFNETGLVPSGYYWSSSENSFYAARDQRYNTGTQTSNDKSSSHSIRCVRK